MLKHDSPFLHQPPTPSPPSPPGPTAGAAGRACALFANSSPCPYRLCAEVPPPPRPRAQGQAGQAAACSPRSHRRPGMLLRGSLAGRERDEGSRTGQGTGAGAKAAEPSAAVPGAAERSTLEGFRFLGGSLGTWETVPLAWSPPRGLANGARAGCTEGRSRLLRHPKRAVRPLLGVLGLESSPWKSQERRPPRDLSVLLCLHHFSFLALGPEEEWSPYPK